MPMDELCCPSAPAAGVPEAGKPGSRREGLPRSSKRKGNARGGRGFTGTKLSLLMGVQLELNS